MGEIVNVKEMIERKKKDVIEKITRLKKDGIEPKLVVIIANSEEASKIYVAKKRKLCEELGIIGEEYSFDINSTTEEIINLINKLNSDQTVDGILVQLPLFEHLDQGQILNSIIPEKDVDGFHPMNIGNLVLDRNNLVACTPKGIMFILENLGTKIEGKTAVVVGRSAIVGKPIAHLLLQKGATVTICHSKTINLAQHTKNADILVVATGIPHLITKDIVKNGAIVIDVGINRINGKVIGDVDTQEVVKEAQYVTSVPGGVGLTTVLSLVENVVQIAEKKLEK